jgi:long-chain acyl-CoA synthetase
MRRRLFEDEEGVVHLRARVLLHHNIKVTVEELLKYCAKRLHPSALPDSISMEERDSGSLD